MLSIALVTISYLLTPLSEGDCTPPHDYGENVEIPFIYKDHRLLGKITVGDPKEGPPQEFTVDFNTEYSEIWLTSKEACPNRDCSTASFKAFDRSMSLTYKSTDKDFSFRAWSNFHEIITGEGKVCTEQFKLGSEQNALVIVDQEFGEINVMHGTVDHVDGMFGLNLRTSITNCVSPIWGLEKQGKRKILPVFGFYINSHQTKPGKFVIGGQDEYLMEGEMNYHAVKSFNEHYSGWFINIDKLVIKWNNGDREDVTMTAENALLSPASLSIVLPSKMYNDVNRKIYSKNTIPVTNNIFQCDADWETLPDIIIVIDGKEYEMNPKDYLVDMLENNKCKSGFTAWRRRSLSVRLGQTFLKKFYVRYNIRDKRVEIAKAKREAAADDPRLPMGVYRADVQH